MLNLPRLFPTIAAALIMTASAPAQTVAVVGNGGQYGFFDLTSPAGSYTQISPDAFQNLQITGLAYAGSGSSGYAIARNANAPADLRTVDTVTGANTITGPINPLIVSPPQSDYYGLAFDTANSSLYSYYNQDDTLRTIGTSSPVVGMVTGGTGLFSTGSPFIGRLAFAGGTLYGTINNGAGGGQQGPGLYAFDMTTAVATFVGDGGGADDTYANLLTFGSGASLYGIDTGNRTLYQISTVNGNLTSLGVIGGLNVPASFQAAVVAPVPEPSATLCVAVAGCFVLLVRRSGAGRA